MIRLFPARVFPMITLMVIGWSNVAFAQPLNNYCVPAPVKENVSIEKIQIGSWASTSLATAQPKNTVEASLFAGGIQNYEFSVQGIPQTRDTFYWQIWVDLNQDLDFEDKGENLLQVATPRKQKATGKILMPGGFSGQLAMRAMLSKTKANDPCGSRAKVLGNYDFWLLGNCPEINAAAQVKVKKVLQEEITLSFNWPNQTKFGWRIKGQVESDWTQSGTAYGDSLHISDLKDFNSYDFQYQLQCGDQSWTNWSDTLSLETLYKAVCRPISLSDVVLDSVGVNYVYLKVLPQSQSERFEYLILSDRDKGDTLTGFNAYGQFKASLKLAGSLYFVQVRNHCLNGGVSEWTTKDEFAFNTLPLPCATPEIKIHKNTSVPYAEASIKGKIAYEWRWRSSGIKEWTSQLSTTDTLALVLLDSIHTYELQTRIECLPGLWTDWSLNYQVNLDRNCPAPSLDSFTVEYATRARVNYNGVEYSRISWDFTPRTSNCEYKHNILPKELDLFTLRGERAYVRMKGLCLSGIESEYSDTLWLEQPCSKLAPNQINVFRITNNSVVISTFNIGFCDGLEFLVTKDSTLPDVMWKSYFSTKNNSINGLEPNTQYYLKARQLCSGSNQKAEFSQVYTFTTLATAPGPCLPLDTTQFKVEFRPPYSIAIILAPELHNSGDQFYCKVNGLDGFGGGFSGNYIKDSILYSQIWVDTRHKISIVRVCGDVWSNNGLSKTFVVPEMPCPKLNPNKIQEDIFSGVNGQVVFNRNVPTPYAPYLWRYRNWNTQVWEDTIVSTTEKVKLPFKHLGEIYDVQIKPLYPANCTDNWSESKTMQTNCSIVYLTSKKVQGNTLEVACNPVDSVFEWAYRPEGTNSWTTFFAGNKVTIKDLKPNTNYEMKVGSTCQIANGRYSTNTFTTKSCFFDSLKIAHDLTSPNLLSLKTNLPAGHKTHRISEFLWEWRPYLDFRYQNRNTDTLTLFNPKPSFTYKISLKYTCDIYNPEQFKMYYHEVTIPPAGQLAIKVVNAEIHELRVIPNPTKGQFNLELPKTIEGLAELFITNFHGQRIYNAQAQISPGATFPLDLSKHPQGVYLVHVRVGNQVYQEKLVLIK